MTAALSCRGDGPTGPALRIDPTPLRPGIVSEPYADTLLATGGGSTRTWSVTSGVLAPGVTLAPTGVFTGTPTLAGAFTFKARVASRGKSKSADVTLLVYPQLVITTMTVPGADQNVAYSTTLTATGGTGTYTWSQTGGELPFGLTLSAGGTIAGTPTSYGTDTATITVSSAATGATFTATRVFIITVTPALAVTTTALADGIVGQAYTDTLDAIGTGAVAAWGVASGSLPAGLTLLASGILSGTPTTAGTSNFTVQVTSNAQVATKPLSVSIVGALVLTTQTLPNGTASLAYAEPLVATGGTGTFAWSVVAGALPAGITLQADGTLVGIPTTPSSSTFTIRVTSGTQQVERQFTVLISSPDATSVEVTPPADSVELGDSLLMTAVAKDAGGVVLPGRAFAWTSLNPATVSVNGLGLVKGLQLGSVGIVATTTGAGGANVSDTAIITVTPRPVDSVEVAPGEASLLLGETLQLGTTLRDRFGNIVTGRVVTWSSSDGNIAAVDPNTGLVTSGAAGTATITAFSEGRQGIATVRVSRGLILTQVTGGLQHSCGVTEALLIFCWGRNSDGQLGDSSTVARLFPVRTRGIASFASVAAGQLHTCALTTGGQAFCWGFNPDGRLGVGDSTRRVIPDAVVGGIAFTQLSAGGAHTCGLTATGVAYCWGLNGDGQLGNNSTNRQLSPALVAGGHVFSTISAGAIHTCALDATGAAWCWGNNQNGQVGDSTNGPVDRIVPTAVAGGRTYSAIGAGSAHSCAIATTGETYCWGQNGSSPAAAAKLGDGTTVLLRNVPTLVAGALSFTSIRVGGDLTCGRVASGSLYCWGLNGSGQLGDGTLIHRNVPTQVDGAFSWDGFGVGGLHGCGIRDAGRTFCWGQNAQGAIGDGTTANRNVPVPVRP